MPGFCSQAGLGCRMDDIVAMQDAPISVIDASGASSNQAGIDAASTGGDELSCVALKMAAASQPSTPQQQQQQVNKTLHAGEVGRGQH